MASPQIRTIVINAGDIQRLVAFWSGFLHVPVVDHDAGDTMIWLHPADEGGIKLAIQQSEDIAAGTNIHLDIAVTDLDETQAELESLGGSIVKVNKLASGFEWRIAADPDGNQFCIFVAT